MAEWDYPQGGQDGTEAGAPAQWKPAGRDSGPGGGSNSLRQTRRPTKEETAMTKFLSIIIAAMFAAVSFSALAADDKKAEVKSKGPTWTSTQLKLMPIFGPAKWKKKKIMTSGVLRTRLT